MVWRAMAFAAISYFATGLVMSAAPTSLGERLVAWHTRVQIDAAYRIALLTTRTQPIEPTNCRLG